MCMYTLNSIIHVSEERRRPKKTLAQPNQCVPYNYKNNTCTLNHSSIRAMVLILRDIETCTTTRSPLELSVHGVFMGVRLFWFAFVCFWIFFFVIVCCFISLSLMLRGLRSKPFSGFLTGY